MTPEIYEPLGIGIFLSPMAVLVYGIIYLAWRWFTGDKDD